MRGREAMKHQKIKNLDIRRTIAIAGIALVVPATIIGLDMSFGPSRAISYCEEELTPGKLEDLPVKIYSCTVSNPELLRENGYDIEGNQVSLIPIKENKEILEKYQEQLQTITVYQYLKKLQSSEVMGMTSLKDGKYNTGISIDCEPEYRGVRLLANGEVKLSEFYAKSFQDLLDRGYPFYIDSNGLSKDYQDARVLVKLKK